MKTIIVISALFAIVGSGCGLIRKKEEIQRYIPGTYVRFSEHEFGRECDTLIISLQNSSVNEYKIVRRWKYERVVDGHKIMPEYKIKVSVAIFDPGRKLLQETGSGRIYTFESSGSLFSGAVKYRKL